MKKSLMTSLALVTLLTSGAAMAQTATTPTTPTTPTTTPDTTVPGHPRVNEIDQRLQNQQKRIDAGVADGQINAKQEARDNARDAKVSQQLSADEAKHNGHITKAEQKQMNKELNNNSKHIHNQKKKAAASTTPAQ